MVTDGPEAGPLWQLKSPACRVICPAGTDEIKSVAVWSPDRGRYWAVRPDRAELDVYRRVAEQVAGEIVASVWPAGTARSGGAGIGGSGVSAAGASLPAEGAELVSLVQELTDPRLVICRVVGVMAQVAAVHVGFSPVLAQAIGRLAGSLASRLTEPEPESPGARVLRYADVTFSVAGELTEYLDVGRVEVRSAPDTARLWDLDRDQPTTPSRTRADVSRVGVQRVQRGLRADRESLPGVSRAAQQPRVDQGRTAPGSLPGVGGASRRRRVSRDPPGPGELPGRSEPGGRGEPPGRGGPPSR